MSWTIAGITVHVDKDTSTLESMHSRQNVLDATSDVIGYYGAKSATRSLQFILQLNTAGSGSLNTLKAASIANANVTVVDDLGVSFTARILKLTYDRIQALNKSLAVYQCSMDLVAT